MAVSVAALDESLRLNAPEALRLRLIRFVFWSVAITLAVCQAWITRHGILSDGISYIEIAQACLRHDWPNAVNAYWSPLYSWILAGLFWLIGPGPYWQAAIAHLALFLAFIASGFALEYFLHQLSAQIMTAKGSATGSPISKTALYIASYAGFLFAGLSLVGLGYCSPDMISFALTFYLCGAVLQVQRGGGTTGLYISLGLACGLFFLARSAFSASFALFIAALSAILWKQRKSLRRPILLVMTSALILIVPFVVAISKKTGTVTIGESGRLNYGWELGGAHRWIHWQGEPFHDIGAPLHPTQEVIHSPRTFVFSHPISGSYPPWYDPSYWYAGIKPKLHVAEQVRALVVNLSVALNYFWRSPITVPALLLIAVSGIAGWSKRFFAYWPILLPMLGGIALYCLIYFEKRYVAANLVVVWILMLAALRFSRPSWRVGANRLLITCAVLFSLVFVGTRQKHGIKVTLTDLLHRREGERNVDYLIAQRLHAAGLRSGDKVAYVGPGMNADWARIAGVTIVAEVPLMYKRTSALLNDHLIDDDSQVKAFWTGSNAGREKVLNAFRNAGAKFVVSDGFFCSDLTRIWPRILPENEERVPEFNKEVFNELNSRYLILGASGTVAETPTPADRSNVAMPELR